jgi:hypothetical protein
MNVRRSGANTVILTKSIIKQGVKRAQKITRFN